MQKFKKGDKVLYDGTVQTIKAMPGDRLYDKYRFLGAHLGCLLDNDAACGRGEWVVQDELAPYTPAKRGRPRKSATSVKSTTCAVGDRVRVITEKPRYGRGNVRRGDIGYVKTMLNEGNCFVEFPTQLTWLAAAGDIERVQLEKEPEVRTSVKDGVITITIRVVER